MEAPKRHRGRPPKYVTGRDGKPIIGLSFDKTRGYYATHARPRRHFPGEFDEALAAFRRWAAPPPVELPITDTGDERVIIRLELGGAQPAIKTVSALADQDALYEWARREIQRDKQAFADRVGIPQIAYLDTLVRPAEVTFDEVRDRYFGRRKRISPKWEAITRMHWSEFVKIIGKRTLTETTDEDFERYQAHVWDTYQREKLSPVWARQRFAAVRAVLRAGLRKPAYQRDVRRLLDYAESFESPAPPPKNPTPISRQHFAALLNAVKEDPIFTAMYLLALNCAFYPVDVASVTWKDIDLDAGHLAMRRGKTGIPRIAVLWPRTIAALRKLTRRGDHLFRSRYGSPFAAKQIGRRHRELRDRAGLPDTVGFDAIRDGAYTAAELCKQANQAELIAGHATGMKDHYVLRTPALAAEGCAAIEAHYFG